MDLAMERTGFGASAGSVTLVPEVHDGLPAAEAVWREAESRPEVLMTPYQRFDWIRAYAAAFGPGERLQPRVAVLRDPGGRLRLLLPLGVCREGGLRVARPIGRRQANFHMPLFASREAAALSAPDLAAALRRLGRVLGVDAFAFPHQPRAWNGCPNPLAAFGEPAASDAFGLALDPDPEDAVRRAFSGDARKKQRQKLARLVAAHGPVEHRRAAGEAGLAAALDAFLAQKAARFAQLGLPDSFRDPAARDFLSALCRPGPDGGLPAAELHALVAAGSGRVFATFMGAVDAGRFSGMLTSFDPDPEVARSSPGDLLLAALIRDQAARGRTALDLGVGEARYKASVCDETIALVDAVVPVTLPGRAYAWAARRSVRLKRRVKQDARLTAALNRLRRGAQDRFARRKS
ncbi:GNAT family N-acetyltransferase [Methylobacterium oryzihabitans]|uniref:GNAT family N-acetyltransferase n=1 Tax=Methylobacterium oryzihabitans TaxID=2499852 RepID=A0A3S2V6N9_9HYPH|nr:GNAT family N-acetyltransferase [Methylobacterium oryzihabitans]RVU15087.1 GNAT family N-acetyltransferase [Methylobacterium oryzihabitans]